MNMTARAISYIYGFCKKLKEEIKMEEYIKLSDAIKIIREEGVCGEGYSDREREDDVINMLERLTRILV